MIFWKFTNNNILTHHFFHVTMKVTQTSSEDSMRKITVYNPAAGDGTAGEGIEGYCTKAPGDCRRFVREACEEDPETHFVVCGGDGTLNEAVCCIMDANAGSLPHSRSSLEARGMIRSNRCPILQKGSFSRSTSFDTMTAMRSICSTSDSTVT